MRISLVIIVLSLIFAASAEDSDIAIVIFFLGVVIPSSIWAIKACISPPGGVAAQNFPTQKDSTSEPEASVLNLSPEVTQNDTELTQNNPDVFDGGPPTLEGSPVEATPDSDTVPTHADEAGTGSNAGSKILSWGLSLLLIGATFIIFAIYKFANPSYPGYGLPDATGAFVVYLVAGSLAASITYFISKRHAALVLVIATTLLALMVSIHQHTGYANFNDCMLKTMQGQAENMRGFAVQECRRLFPQ